MLVDEVIHVIWSFFLSRTLGALGGQKVSTLYVYGKDYFDKLRSIGFKVEEVDYTAQLSEKDIEKYCLAKGEIIPVVYK